MVVGAAPSVELMVRAPNQVRRARQELVLGVRRLARPSSGGLPDFLILGAQRSGTTSLYNYLALHPEIARSFAKEPQYFSTKWSKPESWYRAHFEAARTTAGGTTGRLNFEATPYYLFHPHAAARAARVVPHAKLIVLLRHPVDRALSHYQHNAERGLEELTFDEAVEREPERLAGEVQRMLGDAGYISRAHKLYSYIARGRYAEQLENWMAWFPEERFLILRSEDFYAETDKVYAQVLRFLGVSEWRPTSFANFSKRHARSTLDPDLRARLVETFAPHNERLADLLGRDLAWTS